MASLVVLACGGVKPATAEPTSLDGTAWRLAALPGRSLVEGVPVTLRFEGGRVGGSDGCNQYSGGYTARGEAFEVDATLASTMRACPPDVSEQARAFVAALTGARRVRVAEGRLELLAADGSTTATLTPQSQDLAGTAWNVVNVNNGRQAVVSLLAGTSVTMAFSADGVASGSAGCNRYTARFRSEGSRLVFEPAATTRKACAEPAGVMEQEQQFLRALATVATARVDGDRLELRTAEGAMALVLVAAGAPSLP